MSLELTVCLFNCINTECSVNDKKTYVVD